MRLELPHRVWGGSVLVWPSQASCTLDCLGGKSVNSCTWRHTAGQLEETQTDGQLQPCQCMNYFPKAFTPLCLWFLFCSSLTPLWISWLLSALFHSTMSVKSWLEGYNLRETWDPITDTNILSLQAALPPRVSHILASAAGLCLPGTRQPTCLSRHISFFTV